VLTWVGRLTRGGERKTGHTWDDCVGARRADLGRCLNGAVWGPAKPPARL